MVFARFQPLHSINRLAIAILCSLGEKYTKFFGSCLLSRVVRPQSYPLRYLQRATPTQLATSGELV
ncbi:hypothetical protein FDUTEX481_09283 [Tolypothrix sp. PCC 7601]|nr:hypothetical protein FDUTEX481_09283 [Tolypothrix sp. PCC 7601]